MSNDCKIILVDDNDKQIGVAEKIKCHLGQGILHRAFSIFIFNKNKELLLQKRAEGKMLWPLFWSNTCCSHPRENEDILNSAENRLKEEFGFACTLKLIGKFKYQVNFKDIGSENELCYVFEGEYDGEVFPDKKEILDYKWIDMEDLKRDIKKNPENYTPWFKIEIEKFF
jgi:isopentenyl-diphosphate delta-isomerase